MGRHDLLPIQRRLNYGNSKASKARSVGATNLNHASSRSHAILTVEMNILDEERQKSGSFFPTHLTRPVLTPLVSSDREARPG